MERICQLHLDDHVSTIQVGHPKLMVQCCVRRLSVLCMECIVAKRCEQKLLLRGRINVMSTNRKWHMGYQMVTWPMTSRHSRDFERSNSLPTTLRVQHLENDWIDAVPYMGYHMGYGHVTDDVTSPTKVLWGSTVGYPSDSLASCKFVCNYPGGRTSQQLSGCARGLLWSGIKYNLFSLESYRFYCFACLSLVSAPLPLLYRLTANWLKVFLETLCMQVFLFCLFVSLMSLQGRHLKYNWGQTPPSSHSAPVPLLPLEVGPLIAAMGSGVALYLPGGSGRSPADKQYLANFRLKNLASSSNDLQELFRKWSIKLAWGNWVVTYLCKQTVWTSQRHGRRLARMWRRVWVVLHSNSSLCLGGGNCHFVQQMAPLILALF